MNGNIEYISFDEPKPPEPPKRALPKKKKGVNPGVLFVAIIIVYVAFAFWAESIKAFVIEMFHGGASMHWIETILYAIMISVIFIMFIMAFGIPLIDFETMA